MGEATLRRVRFEDEKRKSAAVSEVEQPGSYSKITDDHARSRVVSTEAEYAEISETAGTADMDSNVASLNGNSELYILILNV